jgi:O-Antigen ligase
VSSIAQPVLRTSPWKVSLPAIAQVSFIIFLVAGDVKADPRLAWLPFDLTIVAAAVTVVLLGVMLRRRNIALGGIFWMVVLFLLMAASLLWSPGTESGTDKAGRFFSLTLLSALAPAVLVRRPKDLNRIVGGLALVGFVMAVDALIQMSTNAGQLIRVASGSGNTISLARDVGVSLLWAYTAFFRTSSRKLLIGLSCVPLFLVMTATGSRGPLALAVLLLAFLTLRFSLTNKKTMALSLAVVLGAVLATTQLVSLLPTQSINRIVALVQQQHDASATERVDAAKAALTAIPEHPMGTGFGGYTYIYTNPVIDQPHNIFLEIAVENGWAPALLFTMICGISLWRSYKVSTRVREAVYLFPMLAFALGNATVSGGLNDNRLLFCLLCVGLQAKEVYRQDYRAEGVRS